MLFGQPLRLAVWPRSGTCAIPETVNFKPISKRLFSRDNERAYRTDARRLQQSGINCRSIHGYLRICKFSNFEGGILKYSLQMGRITTMQCKDTFVYDQPPSCVNCLYKNGAWQERAIEIWIKWMCVAVCSIQTSRVLHLSYWLSSDSGVAWLLTPRARNHKGRL
jgi:hypothetical protein